MRSSDSAVDGLMAGLAAVSAVDVTALPDKQLRSEILDLIRARNELEAALAERVGSFDARELAQVDAHQATSTWLMNFGSMSKGAGLALTGRGRLLRQLPAVATAMRDGAVSVEQLSRVADLVRRVGIDTVREYDHILAALCAAAGPNEVGKACERIHALVDPDGPDPDGKEAFDKRDLTFAQIGQTLYLRGRLDPDGAAIVQAAIDALMRPPAAGDERTAAQRRADALVDLARLGLSGDSLPEVGGERPHVAILITPDILLGQPADPPEPTADTATATANATADAGGGDPLTTAGVPQLPARPWLSWVGEVSTALAQRLACDGIIWRLIVDPRTGLPLDVGDKYRAAPPWMRKALWARDRTCRWPGCDTPAPWTDAHHLVPWWKQQRTSIDGLVSLCRYHHGLVHEGQWSLHLDRATGEVSVTRPDGRPYELGPSRPWTSPSHQGPGPGPPATPT